MSFGATIWLWGLVLVPVCALLFFRAEWRAARRLHEFVAPRLFSQLAGTVNRFARLLKYSLLLAALVFALVALAQPRWGYTYDEKKRKGLDLIFAVDTSRSMLSNDVSPSRLERVKLAAQDLLNNLQGDRAGLIAFAGVAFLQAPLTIDYSAIVDSINDLDTKTIPEGGTNISEAINLALQTFGKSAVGNRALVIFTDGEELSGDAVKSAKMAADFGIRIFTIGVGTPQGSLIPITSDDGGTAFVKDNKGEVVKSKLDDKRLREVAETTGGFYLHLENGPRTMKQLVDQGLSKMQTGEIDARMSRHPIERYEWPLGVSIFALAISFLINDRKRRSRFGATISGHYVLASPARERRKTPLQTTAVVLILSYFSVSHIHARAPGLDLYQQEKYSDAYSQFQKTLQEHPQSQATDKIQFDSGAAAYKMKDYKKALESFSQALLSTDSGLQSSSHYNLGNTLYQRGEEQPADEKKLTDWTNALQHYEETLKLQPQNKAAKDNYEFVKKKIEALKNKKQPSPSPSPPPQSDKNKKQQDQDKQNQQQQDQQQQQNKQNEKQDQNQSQSKEGKDKQEQSKSEGSPSPSPGETPSPSPSASGKEKQEQAKNQSQQNPSPNSNGNDEGQPSPSPSRDQGNESGEGASPSPTPSNTPSPKKFAGEVKNTEDEKKQASQQPAGAEEAKKDEMSPEQAEQLLQSMKDEEERVQLDEHKAVRSVYKDW